MGEPQKPSSRLRGSVRALGQGALRAVLVVVATIGTIARALSGQPNGPDVLSAKPSNPGEYRP